MRDWKCEVRSRLDSLRLAPERSAEIEEELSQHMRDRYEELRAEGLDAASAEQALLRELDEGLEQELRRVEDEAAPEVPLGGGANGLITSWLQDLKYAARSLRKSPGFTFVCVASLALGIGANTAIFQLLNAVQLRTLPVKDAQRLGIVTFKTPEDFQGIRNGRYSEFSYAEWEAIRQGQKAFAPVAAWGTRSWNLANGGEIRYAHGIWVSGDFFRVNEQPAWMGRVITPEDDQPGCATGPAVISYSFWQREYGGAAGVIGRKLTLDGRAFEVVGVTAPDFYGVEVGRVFDVAVPLCTEPIIDAARPLVPLPHAFWLNIMGRLRQGWTVEQASANLDAMSSGVRQQTLPTVYDMEAAKRYLRGRMEVISGTNGYSTMRREYGVPLLLLLTVSGIVLLIACANLANLMLARANVREREIAIRLALGASRPRLVRQLLTEGALLAVTGAALGIELARVLSAALLAFLLKSNHQIYLERPLDWRVLGFTMVVAAVTCLLFALVPSFKATQLSPAQLMNSAGRTMTASRQRFGLRRVLAVAQIALSLVLVIAAVLFVRTLENLLDSDLGFDRNHVLIADCDLDRLHQNPDVRVQFTRELIEQVRNIPGVDSAAASTIIPLSGFGWNNRLLIGGTKTEDYVFEANITPRYFRTMEVPVLQGREFGEEDTRSGEKVAIVNETFVRKFFPKQSPIGQTFKIDVFKGEPQYDYRIVGVVRDTKYEDLREETKPIAYYLLWQDDKPDGDVAIMIRSGLPLGPLQSSVAQTIRRASGSVVFEYSVLRTNIEDGLLRERLLATLSGSFAALAAMLASVGLYGVIAYIVVQRTNEIGVRIALGAMPVSIMKMIVGEAAKLLAIGAMAGLVLSMLLMCAASTLLFGLKPYDPVTMLASLVGLAVVTVAASLLPAIHAARLEPMIALREQ